MAKFVRVSLKMRQSQAILVASVLATVAVVVTLSVNAAGPVAAFEVERGILTGGASVVSVAGQSGTGVVKFSALAPAPTPTPTPTPALTFQSNCIVSPHICGYPDETNTGVPAGTVLTNSGSITVTQAGTIIDSKNITGQVIIRANNVTIRRSRITSGDYYPIDHNNGNAGLLVEDTEVIGTNINVTSGISFANYTARRVNVHGSADGLKADANVVIEDSYIHNLAVSATSHNDAIQTTGGSNVIVRHNTCKLSTFVGANACLQMGNEWGINSGWLVTNNLLDGGGWTINSGSADTNMMYSNNRFTRNAAYGPGGTSGSGITWTGNYYDDTGAVAN